MQGQLQHPQGTRVLAVTGQDPVSVPKRCGAETELPKRWEGQLALGQDLFSLN